MSRTILTILYTGLTSADVVHVHIIHQSLSYNARETYMQLALSKESPKDRFMLCLSLPVRLREGHRTVYNIARSSRPVSLASRSRLQCSDMITWFRLSLIHALNTKD